MKTKLKEIGLVKSIVYALTINVLTLVLILLFANDFISDVQALLIQFIMLVIAAPLYSMIKGDVGKPLIYNALSLLAHIIFSSVITFGVINPLYKGDWMIMSLIIMEFFVLIFYSIVVLIDTSACVITHIKALIRKKKSGINDTNVLKDV